MALSFRKFFLLVVTLVLLLLSFVQMTTAHPLKICNFDQIYQLGDTISDTNHNLIREFPTIGAASAFAGLPYEETYFRNDATSHHLVLVDYIGMAAGLPKSIPSYEDLSMDADFSHGVNFAVAGSTALPHEYLATKNILNPFTTISLNIQLDRMSAYLNSICLDDRDCAEKLKNALFLVGEIGGNDYSYGIFQGKTMDDLKSMVPDVVNAILNGVRRVISHGAKRVVVPGMFPIGCLPIYKTAFQTNDTTAYDENQCLKQLNEFAIFHNEQLQQGLDELKKEEKPHAIIVYGNYYNAYKSLHQVAKFAGFDTERACCGIGGKYNFKMTRMCGTPGVPVCEDPERYISWDGVHLTEEGYKLMAFWLNNLMFPKLQCRL